MSEPYEIVSGPFTVWVAPLGTAFPAIDAAPSGSWIKIGTGGDRNYEEEGVVVTHDQTINKIKTAGAVGAVKALRDDEAMRFEFEVFDVTLEQYAIALNGNTVTTTAAGAGTAGFKSMGLSRGKEVKLWALLARGASPYGDAWKAQYQVPRCYQDGNPGPAFRKGVPAGLAFAFEALEDPGASSEAERFGKLVDQHAAPL